LLIGDTLFTPIKGSPILCRSYRLRDLRGFRRNADDLIGEWPIAALDLPDLPVMFGATDEMLDSSPARPEHVEALPRATGHVRDLDRYNYFVEADAALA
jgi:hypothetical protein